MLDTETRMYREVGKNPQLVSQVILEGIVSTAYPRLSRRILPSPTVLVRKLGFTLAIEEVPDDLGAIRLHGMIVCSPSLPPFEKNVAILHELSHALLECETGAHTERDVWNLTIALALPADSLALGGKGLWPPACQPHLPEWVLSMRAEQINRLRIALHRALRAA